MLQWTRKQRSWHQRDITVEPTRVPRLWAFERFLQSVIASLEEVGPRRIVPGIGLSVSEDLPHKLGEPQGFHGMTSVIHRKLIAARHEPAGNFGVVAVRDQVDHAESI